MTIKKLKPAGLTLVLMDAIPKCRVSGAVQWQSGKPGRAFIDTDLEEHDSMEAEANTWAADFLIPKRDWDAFTNDKNFTKAVVNDFATFHKLHSGIVAGRLEFEKRIDRSKLYGLKLKLDGRLDALNA